MAKPKLGMIVAATAKGEIGYKNTIPWKLKGDLANFRLVTSGQAVIMGRLTYESIGKPLPDRINIVVSSKATQLEEGQQYPNDLHFVSSLSAAIELGAKFGTEWIFFIGGAKIYEAALHLVERVVLTLVHKTGEYDTKIENFSLPKEKWSLTNQPVSVYDEDEATGLPTPSHTYLDYNYIGEGLRHGQ